VIRISAVFLTSRWVSRGNWASSSAIELDAEELAQFPLLTQREVKKTALILITPDKGLTGALNSNILRRASRYVLADAGAPVEVVAAGKKGRDFMLRTRQEVVAEFTGLGDNPSLDDVRAVVGIALDDFVAGRVDAVHLIYAKFVNTLQQVPEVRQVLPIVRPEAGAAGTYRDYIFEPSPAAVLNDLLPRYIEVQVYQAVLESIASEHSARMVAMRNASQNAKDLVSDLSLTYNKARQALITREVAEISAGANVPR
jgi:F-type H+-transporting ATPase subunit gamma